MTTPHPGRFIVFEGLDGAGTTTQVRRLAAALTAWGIPTHTTREPSDGPIGVTIRQALKRRVVMPSGERLSPDTIALLFAADRIDHLAGEIDPRLDAGEWVISDRYVHSSLAYQGAECDVEWVSTINNRARLADLVIFIDVPVDVCVERIATRNEAIEIFEQRDILAAVADRFERALDLRDDPVIRIDGTQSIEAVHRAVIAAVTPLVAAD